MLKIENLTKQYLYGAIAVNALSFEVNEGEHVAILGETASGKTSLLKAIAGLYPITEGKIFNNGKDITEAEIKDRDVLLVQDDGGIFRRHTVKYNLEYPLKVRKLPKTERLIKVEEIAKQFGLSAFLRDYCFLMYAPDIVKLSLARTAIRNSPLVMIDDIFALLPSAQRKKVFEECVNYIAGIKSSLLFATTSVEEAFSVGERVVFMSYGKAAQIGTPNELRSNPQALCVDKYINHNRNFAEVPVDKSDVVPKISFGGKTYSFNESFNEDYVVVSYALKADAFGERFVPVSCIYEGDKRYIISADGIKYHNEVDDAIITVSPDTESIRIYSLINERRLTFSIK